METKTRAKSKLRLNMKRILNVKLKEENITVIEDSSTEEDMGGEEELIPRQVYSEEEYPVSFKLSQGRDKVSEEPITFSVEKGMTSKFAFILMEFQGLVGIGRG